MSSQTGRKMARLHPDDLTGMYNLFWFCRHEEGNRSVSRFQCHPSIVGRQ